MASNKFYFWLSSWFYSGQAIVILHIVSGGDAFNVQSLEWLKADHKYQPRKEVGDLMNVGESSA